MANNKELDLGNLTLLDFNAVQRGSDDAETADNITAQLVGNLQFVLNSLVDLKKKEISAVEVLPEEEQIHDFEKSTLYVMLPEPVAIFPRSRKLPDAKKETKWERFAKEKGIKKRKHAGMAYDPTLNTQVARWGRNSKKNAVDLPIMEEKVAGRDPFKDAKTEKKLRVAKNKLSQSKNVRAHSKISKSKKK
jgi:regulator of ribosome biosynthesis